MKLRKLQIKDASLMLEWMHDDEIVHYLRDDFASKKIDDCLGFINEAQDEAEGIHLAIADDQDEYMGTVSLKHINGNTAELGIVLRTIALGRGYAFFAINEVIKYGFEKRDIKTVYWCVDPENHRALNFYEKYDYKRCDVPIQTTGYTEKEKQKFIWYCVEK